jgi:hypothetical protein
MAGEDVLECPIFGLVISHLIMVGFIILEIKTLACLIPMFSDIE